MGYVVHYLQLIPAGGVETKGESKEMRQAKHRYCDDIECPNLIYGYDDDNCELGFHNSFRIPESIADAVYHNWGYLMPSICKRFPRGREYESRSALPRKEVRDERE